MVCGGRGARQRRACALRALSHAGRTQLAVASYYKQYMQEQRQPIKRALVGSSAATRRCGVPPAAPAAGAGCASKACPAEVQAAPPGPALAFSKKVSWLWRGVAKAESATAAWATLLSLSTWRGGGRAHGVEVLGEGLLGRRMLLWHLGQAGWPWPPTP